MGRRGDGVRERTGREAGSEEDVYVVSTHLSTFPYPLPCDFCMSLSRGTDPHPLRTSSHCRRQPKGRWKDTNDDRPFMFFGRLENVKVKGVDILPP